MFQNQLLGRCSQSVASLFGKQITQCPNCQNPVFKSLEASIKTQSRASINYRYFFLFTE